MRNLTLLNRDLSNFKSLWTQISGLYNELEAQDREISVLYDVLCKCLLSTGNSQVQQYFSYAYNR